jgi:hypothetical protein
MKIMCIIRINCPLNDGLTPSIFPPTIEQSEWFQNFNEYTQLHSDGYIKYNAPDNDWYCTSDDKGTNYSTVLLFDSQEELDSWISNCRLTDPVLKSDMDVWKSHHRITITYEYYSLSTINSPDPIM